MKRFFKLALLGAVFAFSVHNIYAQSFQSFFNAAKKTIQEEVSKATGISASIVGTWNYSKPAIKLESDNKLAEIGSSAASGIITDKLSAYYEKVGIKPGCFSLTFAEDSTVTTKILGKELKGSYKVSEDNTTLSIGLKAGGKMFNTTVSIHSDTLDILIEADKLLSLIQTIIEKLPSNASFSAVESLLKQYNGIKVGFEFTR